MLFTPQERWSEDRIAAGYADVRKELAAWETASSGEYLAGPLSAADFTLYPYVALVLRIAKRKPAATGLVGPMVSAWMRRMETLPCTQKTWPPHWK